MCQTERKSNEEVEEQRYYIAVIAKRKTKLLATREDIGYFTWNILQRKTIGKKGKGGPQQKIKEVDVMDYEVVMK